MHKFRASRGLGPSSVSAAGSACTSARTLVLPPPPAPPPHSPEREWFLQIDLGLSMSLAFRLPISCTDSTRSLSRSRLRVLLCSCEFRASWATAVVGGAWRELYCEENKSLNEFCDVVCQGLNSRRAARLVHMPLPLLIRTVATVHPSSKRAPRL